MKATLCGALKLNGAKEEEDLLLRRVEALNKKMLEIVNESVENGEDIESREDEFKNISDEISRLNERISAIRKAAGQDVNARGRVCGVGTGVRINTRICGIFAITDRLREEITLSP